MRFLLYIIFLLLAFPLNAAGPMTHLYFAECFCKAHGIWEEEKARKFMVGTLFPDIRYFAKLSREETHLSVAGLEDVLKERDPFRAGMKFHNWVDIVREEIVAASGIYTHVEPHAEGQNATFLKLIEEEILADFYDGRKWSYCFEKPLSQERFLVASDDTIMKWHEMIQYAMSYRPSWLFWGASYMRSSLFGIPDTMLYAWSYALPKLAKDACFQQHVKELHEKILEAIYTYR